MHTYIGKRGRSVPSHFVHKICNKIGGPDEVFYKVTTVTNKRKIDYSKLLVNDRRPVTM